MLVARLCDHSSALKSEALGSPTAVGDEMPRGIVAIESERWERSDNRNQKPKQYHESQTPA